MPHTICTFNINNLYARYQFGQTYPGDRAAKSLVEDARWGYLPIYNPALFELFNPVQRELAARAITDDGKSYPDVVCLQEVESLLTLRKFNEEHLKKEKYEHALLIDSRDFRQIDVAVLSRLEILSVRSHVDDLDPAADGKSPWLFSRDCLEIEIGLNQSGSRRMTLFVNHLKSKYAESADERKKADALRKRQAQAILQIVQAKFPGPRFDQEFFAIIGDLNDEPASPALKSLVSEPSGLVDALARIQNIEDRWTHWYRSENTVSQLDHILLSPALAAATDGNQPRIERRGIGFSRVLRDGGLGPRKTFFHRIDGDPNPIEMAFRFERFDEVTPEDYASDHCPVFFEVP